MKINKRNCLTDEKGATAVEYSIIASLIAATITVAVSQLGVAVLELYRKVVPGW